MHRPPSSPPPSRDAAMSPYYARSDSGVPSGYASDDEDAGVGYTVYPPCDAASPPHRGPTYCGCPCRCPAPATASVLDIDEVVAVPAGACARCCGCGYHDAPLLPHDADAALGGGARPPSSRSSRARSGSGAMQFLHAAADVVLTPVIDFGRSCVRRILHPVMQPPLAIADRPGQRLLIADRPHWPQPRRAVAMPARPKRVREESVWVVPNRPALPPPVGPASTAGLAPTADNAVGAVLASVANNANNGGHRILEEDPEPRLRAAPHDGVPHFARWRPEEAAASLSESRPGRRNAACSGRPKRERDAADTLHLDDAEELAPRQLPPA